MNQIDLHIQDHLNSFISSNKYDYINKQSENIALSNQVIKELGEYFLALISCFLSVQKSSELSVLHVHIDSDLSFDNKVYLGRLINVVFFNHLHSRALDDKNNSYLKKINQELKARDIALRTIPAKASGNNRVAKQWKKDKKKNRSLISFYQEYSEKKIDFGMLFNSQVKYVNRLFESFENYPFALSLESKGNLQSHNILNSTNTLSDIDEIDSELIDNLRHIILFDCISKSKMLDFSLFELEKWNTEFNTNFQSLLLVTFGRDRGGVNETRKRLSLVRNRFKVPESNQFMITEGEINYGENRPRANALNPTFLGPGESVFWDEFRLKTKVLDLYELRSIKLLNVYSLCFNNEIKEIIIEDIFSLDKESSLVSIETRQLLIEQGEEESQNLKSLLEKILALVIEVFSSVHIEDFQKDNVLIEDACLKNERFVTALVKALNLSKNTDLISWRTIEEQSYQSICILSYRDQGRFPFSFYPNLIECQFEVENGGKAFLLNFFFKKLYDWAIYNIQTEYFKQLEHPFRYSYFHFEKLKQLIKDDKPLERPVVDWTLENEYSREDSRELYKITIDQSRSRTVLSSDLFIVSPLKSGKYKVERVDSFEDNLDGEVQYQIQALDSIQDEINIYDSIVDLSDQRNELSLIKEQFNIDKSESGRLWKVLLKERAMQVGEDKVYFELKELFKRNVLNIVSESHFESNWLNPDSESLAPVSKKMFKLICEYLELPKVYFLIIQRIKNSLKQSNRKSTRQMNSLLKQLFNDGAFDESCDPEEIIQSNLNRYIRDNPVEDLGIEEEYLKENLIALIELIKPEINVFNLISVEKIEP